MKRIAIVAHKSAIFLSNHLLRQKWDRFFGNTSGVVIKKFG
ncbi:hypothetical protein AVDCRST_MAG92-4779 [uncultured Coleofasciculus sp.]|uniref:Uncharacterized protein n=1 Tax=uncultured Coleofasciculus sp. TaxID=1267456 RepID=A0A6J4K6H7_9CYAN|nr:hypothetical protein AVDCRST_MAG92-4779 [uncultured Coleofasciculus sp.]